MDRSSRSAGRGREASSSQRSIAQPRARYIVPLDTPEAASAQRGTSAWNMHCTRQRTGSQLWEPHPCTRDM
eukprot:687875-Pyramimonas_sp.AAC.1